MEIVDRLVKNYSSRYGSDPIAIVIHVAEGYYEGTISWCNNSASQASYHYLIDKNGTIARMVNENNKAWHSGNPNNSTATVIQEIKEQNGYGINANTISIARVGFYNEPMTKEQENAMVELVNDICNRYNITKDRTHIIGHYEIDSVNRKNCPNIDLNILVNKVNALNKQESEEENGDDIMFNELVKKYGKDVVLSVIDELCKAKTNANVKEWAKDELKEAMNKGITDGTRPNEYATRTEVALMVNRAIKS